MNNFSSSSGKKASGIKGRGLINEVFSWPLAALGNHSHYYGKVGTCNSISHVPPVYVIKTVHSLIVKTSFTRKPIAYD